MGYFTVKIVRIGSPVVEVTVPNSGATVADALAAANIATEAQQAYKFKGRNVSLTSPINDNGDLIVSKQVAGA